jgi:hypothetical protein
VRGNAIENRTRLDNDVRHRQSTLKDSSAVWLCEDCLLKRAADFASVYIKRRNKLDIATAIAADRVAHDTLDCRTLAFSVVFDPLDQRTGAIADTGNGYFNVLSHRHGILMLPV